LGVSQRWEFKNTTAFVLQKSCVEKVLQKNSTKDPKPNFLDCFFISVFGRFPVGEAKISGIF
jgi:hypothetical protein